MSYQQTDYSFSSYYNQGYYSESTNKISLFDKLLLFISIILLLISILFGFIRQNRFNREIIKQNDMDAIVIALDNFYENSSRSINNRRYPVATCSGKLNEVDYEYTLKNHLAGNFTSIDNHIYISEQNFPNDPYGQYTRNKSGKKTLKRGCDVKFGGYAISDQLGQIYIDNSSSCEFDINNENFKNCYLYTSDTRGFSYQLAYYSKKYDTYVIYSKDRDKDIVVTYSNR